MTQMSEGEYQEMYADPEMSAEDLAELERLEAQEQFRAEDLAAQAYRGPEIPEPGSKTRNRPSRTPKERALYRLGQIQEQVQRLGGYGLAAELHALMGLVEAMLGKVEALPDDYKVSRATGGGRLILVGQIYEVATQRDQYSRLAGEPVEFGLVVGELDEKTVRIQVGEGAFIPVKRSHLGKRIE